MENTKKHTVDFVFMYNIELLSIFDVITNYDQFRVKVYMALSAVNKIKCCRSFFHSTSAVCSFLLFTLSKWINTLDKKTSWVEGGLFSFVPQGNWDKGVISQLVRATVHSEDYFLDKQTLQSGLIRHMTTASRCHQWL